MTDWEWIVIWRGGGVMRSCAYFGTTRNLPEGTQPNHDSPQTDWADVRSVNRTGFPPPLPPVKAGTLRFGPTFSDRIVFVAVLAFRSSLLHTGTVLSWYLFCSESHISATKIQHSEYMGHMFYFYESIPLKMVPIVLQYQMHMNCFITLFRSAPLIHRTADTMLTSCSTRFFNP